MRTLGLFALVAAALLVSLPAQAQRDYRTRSSYDLVRCESYGTRQNFCPADTRRGIRIADDFSGRCRIGQTWGYTGRGIWVAGGCGADFALGRGDNYGWGWGFSDNRYVVCASDDYQRKFCPAPTGRGVRLVNQISNSACIRGRTWWRDERGIVVDNGCAGEFEIGYRDGDYRTAPATGAGGPYRPQTFTCVSTGSRRYCRADVGYGAVTLRRPTPECVYGRTWGYDRDGVWVSQRCAGEFEVGYVEQEWRPGPDVRWVRCESHDYSRSICDTGGARRATLQRQLSRSACVEGRTWGFDGDDLWVDDGCAGDFLLR